MEKNGLGVSVPWFACDCRVVPVDYLSREWVCDGCGVQPYVEVVPPKGGRSVSLDEFILQE